MASLISDRTALLCRLVERGTLSRTQAWARASFIGVPRDRITLDALDSASRRWKTATYPHFA